MLGKDRQKKKWLLVIACGFALAHHVHADSITLKTAVRLTGDGQNVSLGSIADLQGPEAARFADLEVCRIAVSAAPMEISIKDVRAALDQAGVNWGVVNLSGRTVIVRPARDGSAAPPLAMTAAALERSVPASRVANESRTPLTAQDLVAEPTIRGAIAARIVDGLHADARRVRLTFDDADSGFLETLRQDARIEIDPQSSFHSDRIAITVRVWNGERVQQHRTISVQPWLLVKAATLLKDIDKDEVISEHHLAVTEQWLPPSQVSLTTTVVQAVGRVTGEALRAGEIVRSKSLRRDSLVKRGEQITVRCLVGGIAITMQAEARADGGDGDVIELRKPGERETFRATITGRSEAVVDLRQKDRHATPAT